MTNLITFELIQLVLAAAILLFLARKLHSYAKTRYNMYKLTKNQRGPSTIELFKCLLKLGKNPEDFVNIVVKVAKKYFPTCFFWLGDMTFFVISDPEDLQIILNDPDALEKSYIYFRFTRLLGRGLFTAPLHIWKNTRKAASPFFSNKNLNEIAQMACERANVWVETDLKKARQKSPTLDVYDVIKIFTFSLNLEVATGVQLKLEMLEHLEELSKKGLDLSFERSCKVHLHPQPIFELTKLAKNLKNVEDNFIGLLEEVIMEKKQNCTAKPKNSAYYEYLTQQSKTKDFLTPEQIRDEVSTFVNAGYDTVAITTSFLLWMLGMHQDIQQKLYDEIMEVLGPTGVLTANDLPQFKYLDMAIKEILRLFPVAPIQSRQIHRNIKLKTCTVPSGSFVIIPNILIHRDERIWPNPMKFDPERFLPEELQKRHPYSYIPFLAGPRSCIGKKFGTLFVKSLIPGIVRKYKIHAETKPIETIRLKSGFLLDSVDGYTITLELRK